MNRHRHTLNELAETQKVSILLHLLSIALSSSPPLNSKTKWLSLFHSNDTIRSKTKTNVVNKLALIHKKAVQNIEFLQKEDCDVCLFMLASLSFCVYDSDFWQFSNAVHSPSIVEIINFIISSNQLFGLKFICFCVYERLSKHFALISFLTVE